MPLDPNKEYQAADAVEIIFPNGMRMATTVAYRRWTGEIQSPGRGILMHCKIAPEPVQQVHETGWYSGHRRNRYWDAMASATGMTHLVLWMPEEEICSLVT